MIDGQLTKARSAKTLKTSVLFWSWPIHHAFTPVQVSAPLICHHYIGARTCEELGFRLNLEHPALYGSERSSSGAYWNRWRWIRRGR